MIDYFLFAGGSGNFISGTASATAKSSIINYQ
jgi:hypothetical protein